MSDDIIEALENADEIAELTGRDKSDVIADLLDDGKLNNSNAIKENTSAIDKATQTAEKVHKLLVTLIPILLLVATSGLELGGIINFTPAGKEEPFWQEEEIHDNIYWGCTDSNAENYDDQATNDDATCHYSNDERSIDITNIDSSLTPDGDLKLEFAIHLEGSFDFDPELILRLWLNDEEQVEMERTILHSYDEETGYIEQYWSDLESGEWLGKVFAEWNGELFDEETFEPVIIEGKIIEGCTDSNADNYNEEATEDDGSCEYEPEPCDDSDEDGICDEDEIEGCTDDTATNYQSEATDDNGSCEYPPPEKCEPILYSAYPFYQNNNTTVSVTFDIDCTNLVDERFNVTVQWLAWHNGSNHSNSEGPANWTTADYTIQGEEWDEHTLSLSNFTNGSYDLYLYIMWDDNMTSDNYIERKWFNIEIESW
tara:strand:+ start:763 stop:2046 length:1284 start_codon:yes stop_codon:yes gene_type:complete